MAKAAAAPYSNYFYGLSQDMKSRYLTKLAIINGQDPYSLNKGEFSKDPEQLPQLGYPDIVFYLLHSQNFLTHEEVKNYKSLLSYKYFVSGWVLDVGWKAYDESPEVVLAIGKVRHSYSTNKPPLYPWVIMKQSGAVLLGHCTCMAGLAETCSHVGAILHWIEAAVRINMSTTSTSRENSWLMPRAIDNTPFLELKNISFTAASKSVAHSAESLPSPPPVPTAVEKENFFKELSKEQNKIPIVLSVISPYNAVFITSDEHLPQLFSTLYNPINSEKSQSELLQLAADYSIEPTTTDKVKRLATITADQSKSKVWFQYRAGRITASRLKQVTHTSATKPSISLIKSICYPDIYLFRSDATKYGCAHESDALLAYERKSAVLHQGFTTSKSGFFVSTDYPFLGASPDGLVECSCCGKGVLEVKCPFRCKELTIESLVESSTNFYLKRQSDGTFCLDHDHSYYYQCQLQMFATDRQYCDFVVWSKESQLHVERITLDESFIQAQIPVAMKFWRLCILPELLGKLYSRQQTMSVSEERIEEDQGKWCHCKQEKGGEMIGCDNKTCKIKWYHVECVSMSSTSIPQGKWFCLACRSSLRNK